MLLLYQFCFDYLHTVCSSVNVSPHTASVFTSASLFCKSLLSFSPSDTLILIPLLKRWELCVDKIISMSDLWPRLFQRYSHRSCVWETSTTQMFVTPLTYPLRNTGSSLSGIPQAPGSSATASARVRSLGFQISTHEEHDHFSLASVNLKSLQKWGGGERDLLSCWDAFINTEMNIF